jgi:hypothetical protein
MMMSFDFEFANGLFASSRTFIRRLQAMIDGQIAATIARYWVVFCA